MQQIPILSIGVPRVRNPDIDAKVEEGGGGRTEERSRTRGRREEQPVKYRREKKNETERRPCVDVRVNLR